MEKINRSISPNIKTHLNPEVILDFYQKMEETGIYKCNSFINWLLDKWITSESGYMGLLSPSVCSFIALMSKQVPQRGSNVGGRLCFSRFKSGSKESYDWIISLREISNKSSYKRPTNVIRCMIHAIVMSSQDSLRELKRENDIEKIERIKFRAKDFRSRIRPDIYNRIEIMYDKSPTTVVRYILDVLLGEKTQIRALLVKNMDYKTITYTDSNKGKWVSLEIFNDSYRLKLFDFMASHSINCRSMLIHKLINLALILPDLEYPIFSDGVFESCDTYEENRYSYMAINNYKYTGS